MPSHPMTAAATPALWGLIPCAGVGLRAGGDRPKQYQMLAGRPMVMHSLHAWAALSELRATVVVIAADDRFWDDVTPPSASIFISACGGSTRAESVFNGLHALLQRGAAAHDWVLVHDAARCLILPADVRRLIDACGDDEVGGLLAQPLPDTLKQAKGDRVAATLSRTDKWLAQTPQMARIGQLLQALEVGGDGVTDEASALEAQGLMPRLVRGGGHNFKLTYPDDWALADAVLRARQADRSNASSDER